MIHESKEVDYKLFGCWRGQRPFYVENNATGEISKDILLLLTILTLAFANYNTNTLLQIHKYTNLKMSFWWMHCGVFDTFYAFFCRFILT